MKLLRIFWSRSLSAFEKSVWMVSLIQKDWLWMLFAMKYLFAIYHLRIRREKIVYFKCVNTNLKFAVDCHQGHFHAYIIVHVQHFMSCLFMFRYSKWLQFRRISPPSQNKRSDHQWTDSETKILFYLQDFPPTSCLTLQPLW